MKKVYERRTRRKGKHSITAHASTRKRVKGFLKLVVLLSQ